MKQKELFKKGSKAYGGELLKTRKGRSMPRPLSTKNTMHLVLRSSQAKGDWSFSKKGTPKKIETIVIKFAQKYGIKIISLAVVCNHMHFQVKLVNRLLYRPFIRAITSAIAMMITGASRWAPKVCKKFWDYRPFTRVVIGWRAFLNLKDYIEVNQLEGFGYSRHEARFIIDWNRACKADSS